MANIKSAIKRIQSTKNATLRNAMFKSSMKSAIKKFEAALESGNKDEAKNALNFAIKKIDMATSKGILHKNAADRKKSQLAVRFNKTIAS